MAGTLHLPGNGHALPPSPALLNDVQLVALVAAVLAPTGGGSIAVDEAFELVAEVLVKAGQGRLKESIEAYRASVTT